MLAYTMLVRTKMILSPYAIALTEKRPRAWLIGAGAGAAATLAMSALMLVAQRSGLLGRSPPRHIVDHALAGLHLRNEVSRNERQLLAAMAHLAFGASQGALYAALHHWRDQWLARREQRPRPPSAATAVPFALLVWAASYVGWIPALGILPSPPRDRPGRPMSMVLAHVVYGVTLAGTLRTFARSVADQPPARSGGRGNTPR